MRISDWSSDVCSSDLHPGEAGIAAGTAGEAAALPPERITLLGERPGRVEPGMHEQHAALAGVGIAPQAGEPGLVPRHRLHRGLEPAGPAGPRQHALVGAGKARSDEHTSELQSLLRTYY